MFPSAVTHMLILTMTMKWRPSGEVASMKTSECSTQKLLFLTTTAWVSSSHISVSVQVLFYQLKIKPKCVHSFPGTMGKQGFKWNSLLFLQFAQIHPKCSIWYLNKSKVCLSKHFQMAYWFVKGLQYASYLSTVSHKGQAEQSRATRPSFLGWLRTFLWHQLCRF